MRNLAYLYIKQAAETESPLDKYRANKSYVPTPQLTSINLFPVEQFTPSIDFSFTQPKQESKPSKSKNQKQASVRALKIPLGGGKNGYVKWDIIKKDILPAKKEYMPSFLSKHYPDVLDEAKYYYNKAPLIYGGLGFAGGSILGAGTGYALTGDFDAIPILMGGLLGGTAGSITAGRRLNNVMGKLDNASLAYSPSSLLRKEEPNLAGFLDKAKSEDLPRLKILDQDYKWLLGK